MDLDDLTRRSFLEQAAAAGLVLSLGASAARAAAAGDEEKVWPDTGVGVIGLGAQGRVLLEALGKLPWAKVKGLADPYQASHRRAGELAPEAAKHTDYRALLADAAIQAVFIATPTHLHKQVVLDALQAGKHVYCEAPLAHTIDEARAIAQAGKAATTRFCVGHQLRATPLYPHSRKFVLSGVLKDVVAVGATYRKKHSWRMAGATPEREAELNWRLDPAVSTGLVGEVGIHPLEYACWALRLTPVRPVRVSGVGSILAWKDGREVADTVSVVYELENGVRLKFDATLGGSYGGTELTLVGTDGTIILRGERGWLVKEADAPQMGWEGYARKDDLLGESGIVLIANATKLLEQDKLPSETANHGLEPGKDPWFYTVEHFLQRVNDGEAVACSAEDGFAAAVLAIRGNEAVATGQTVAFAPDAFTL